MVKVSLQIYELILHFIYFFEKLQEKTRYYPFPSLYNNP